jgi:copper resistance protein C
MACLWVTESGLTASGRALAIAAAAFGLAMVGGTGIAVAAGDQVGTSPAADVVTRAPLAVSVTFSKPLRPDSAQMLVLTAVGDVGTGKVTTSARTLRRQLKIGSPPGDYRVEWRAISADGRPMSGAFTFFAGHSNAEPQITPEPTVTVTVTAEPTMTTPPPSTAPPSSTAPPPSTAPASVPAPPPAPPTDRSVSSGFTLVPLIVGALLVLAAGLIAKFNKPHLHA